MADEIRQAIKEFLSTDSVIEKISTGVFYELAPPGQQRPYVIFGKPTGGEDWAFAGQPMEDDAWIVKGVGKTSQAEDIDKRCRELLNQESIVIENRSLLFLRSQAIVSYLEVNDDGERFQHEGHVYKLISERD